MNSSRLYLSRSLALLALSCVATSSTFAAQASEARLSLQLRTDITRHVPGAPVLISAGSESIAYTTDVNARAGGMDIPVGSTAVVTFGTARTRLGSTVGQVVTVDLPATNADISERDFTYFAPEARMVQFKAESDPSAPGFIVQDPSSEAWYAHSFASSPSYDFQAGVASLRSPASIDAYFAFHQMPTPDVYIHGLLLRSHQDVAFDTHERICFAIGRDTHQYASPSIDVINITNSPHAASAVTYLGEDSEFTYVALEGGIPRGDTLILVSSGQGAGNPVIAPDPTVIPPPSAGGGGGAFQPLANVEASMAAMPAPTVAALAFAPNPSPMIATTLPEELTPCQPDPPADGSYCTDREPGGAPDNDCGATLVTVAGSTSSNIVPAWSGNPPCNDGGITKEKQICWEVAGGVEFGFDVGDAVEINVNGSISRVSCAVVSVAPCTCVGSWSCEWETTVWYRRCKEYTVWREWFTFETIQTWTRVPVTRSGKEAIEQETTCTLTSGNCG